MTSALTRCIVMSHTGWFGSLALGLLLGAQPRGADGEPRTLKGHQGSVLEAMQKAVEDALASARAYAAGAKVTITEVVTIDGASAENDFEPRGVGNPLHAPADGNVEIKGLAAGGWVVSSRVRVVCRF
jgi:hypothetical protein